MDGFPLQQLQRVWRERFGVVAADSYWSIAPGRVNLIGEHTDYHGGFVLPAAIDLKTYLLASVRNDDQVRCYSINQKETKSFSLKTLLPEAVDGWVRYVAACAWSLQQRGYEPCGLDIVMLGTIPFGGGLSSSASLEVACLTLWNTIQGLGLHSSELAQLGQQAENGFVGVPCGIMDQFASAVCEDGHAMKLDCRSLKVQMTPIPKDWKLVVLDTGVHHELASSEYAKRQQECAIGLEAVRRRFPQVELLRDVDRDMLDAAKGDMPELSFRRCGYVLAENDRVGRFTEALANADKERAGELLAASHAGLRDDYNVSCIELDRAVELAQDLPGLIGARMTGGGFGGCTVNLVSAELAEEFQAALQLRYQQWANKGQALLLTPSGGARGGKCDDDSRTNR